ncbi:hypothetical protein [Natronobiforma cellulositropha]|uniref:hypothetical protein n=1 Tax=Natronobiforma cellulositropha TaxID=1679076 RepID=UPI0021D61139|nr:hypothetical protein [Natronobiforma cellulositropha]
MSPAHRPLSALDTASHASDSSAESAAARPADASSSARAPSSQTPDTLSRPRARLATELECVRFRARVEELEATVDAYERPLESRTEAPTPSGRADWCARVRQVLTPTRWL